MNILIVSSGNIVQLAKYPRYFARQGHKCVFINPEWSNTLCNRTQEDEFGGLDIEFYTWPEFRDKRIWENIKFDCIFGTQHGATMPVWEIQQNLKIPALLQILDIAEGTEIARDEKALVCTQRQMVQMYSLIDNLTGINPAIPEQIQKLNGRRDCHCIFYPIDIELFDSIKTQKTEDFVLIVSRHSSYKRVDLAIRACAYAKKKLVLVSGNDDNNALHKLADEVGADVQFLGFIPDKQKVELMKRCKLHIFTQMWAEAPCIPSAEALYCKKPSIIFDYPAQRAIEGGYSYYIEPGDWKAMGKQIKWIDTNYEEATKFAIEGYNWVKHNLAPDIVSSQILNILVKITKEKNNAQSYT